MKFVYLFFLLLLLCTTLNTHAQTGNLVGGSAASAIQMNTFPFGTITTFGLAEKTVSLPNF